MTKLIESILDNDKDIEAKLDVEAYRMIRDWMLKNAWISDKNFDLATIDDFDIVDGIIYLKKTPKLRGIKFYENADFPPYIRFGYVGKEFGLMNTNATDISHIFDKISRDGIKDLKYIDIEDNQKLKKIFDLTKFKKLFCITIKNNPDLGIDVNRLADTWISLRVIGNKNKIDVDDVKKKYSGHIIELDDYSNQDEYE